MPTAQDPEIVEWLKLFNCSSCEELYSKLEQIHAEHKPVEGEHVPFSLHDIKHFSTSDRKVDIICDVTFYWGAYKAAELIKDLRKNPPKKSFENPVVHQCSSEAEYSAMSTLIPDVDLPGSKYNFVGHGYYSDLFFHMFFGNYSDFIEHIKKLSKQDLKKTLKTREGYPQFSPLFAPIIGRRMIHIESIKWLTEQNKRDIRLMYRGNNENKQVKILEKLLKLGADPNAHDILGNTLLCYAAYSRHDDTEKIVSTLLRYGANPNYSIQYNSILFALSDCLASQPGQFSIIDLMLSYNAKPRDYEERIKIRYEMETEYTLEYAVKLREACPKKKNECERTECEVSTVKKCGACDFVVYCTPACQKLDWKFHKPTCKKKREEKALENSA